MGEPLEAVEGSDSEISRLFPKCRPRSATHTPTTTTPTTTPSDARRSDLNLNCVLDSDDNDNYETETITTAGDLPTIYDNSKLSRDSGSSGRMSVDSGSGSRSGSTPGSRSGSHSGSHSESTKMERSAEDVDMDMDVSVVSGYDEYDERYMRSSVLDSSYEEPPPPPPTSRPQAPRREHFRLRDSRIEIAGGREVFSHSRSRPARRRHDESQRRGSQQVQHQQYPHDRQQQEQQWPESPGDSEGRGRGSSVRESPLVYETRLTGSSEVVFDDIGEWVARGLTVRALDDRPGSPSSPTADHQVNPAEHGDHGYLAAYERSTSPSDSDSTQGSPHKVTKIGNVPIAEYEGSPRRYGPRPSPRTHSPRGPHSHHGPPPRPPRPGFPRRVLAEEAAAREAHEAREALPPAEVSIPPRAVEETGQVATQEDGGGGECPPDSSCSEGGSMSPAPPVIAISTLTSSYSTNLAPQQDASRVDSDMYDYSYEMSETRKVLEEFFKEQGGSRGDEFLDLEYHLKRQQGNSYVGLRLAAEYAEDQAEGAPEECPSDQKDGGSEQHSNAPDHRSDIPEHHSSNAEHHSSVSEHHQEASEHQHASGTEQQRREQQCNSGSSAAHGLEPDLDATTYEVSSASPPHHHHHHHNHLHHHNHHQYHLELSYEAQQEAQQDHVQHHHHHQSVDCNSNCSHSSNSGVGIVEDPLNLEAFPEAYQEDDDVEEDVDDENEDDVDEEEEEEDVELELEGVDEEEDEEEEEEELDLELEEIDEDEDFQEQQQQQEEKSALYDRLNEVVAAALGRDSLLDGRSGDETASCSAARRPCRVDIPSSGREDQGGCCDLSTEGEHDAASTNPETEDLPQTEVGLQVGHSRNFTLSPETTSCDSGDVESDYSGVDPEGSIHSSSRGICSAMPVLEDGLSSGDESGMDEREETKEVLYEKEKQEEAIIEQEQHHHQRPIVRSLDEQLCRGELPPLNPLPTLNSHNSPLPNAASSPHSKVHSRNSPHTNTQSPSSSTLTLMKKQITEIEREIALRKPEGGPRRGGLEGDGPHPPLDLHLLDPLNEKVIEPPPPPAPHPHRGGSTGNSSVVENGSSSSTPIQMPTTAVSPSRVLGHLHSPQYTPGPSAGPHLLSAMGSLTSPVQHQVTPHMVPGHPAAHDILHNPGGGVGQSRESVEAAIADIKQAIRRTKNMTLKSHPQERSPINDKGPVWIPRNNRREPQQQQQQQQPQQQQPPPQPQTPQQQQQPPSCQQSQQQSPQSQQHSQLDVAEASRTPEHVRHEDEDGDTDQETDRLLGQQRSDDPGFYDEKGWRRPKTRTVMPRAANHKANGGGATSNGSTPSTPIGQGHQVSANQTPSTPPDMAASNKNKNKKEKETNKKKGRSKEVLIEGVLFRARYLGSTQLVSEGQPTKTTRMMQAEEAVSRIKDADDDKEALVDNHDPQPPPGPPHSASPQESPISHHSPVPPPTAVNSSSSKEYSSPRNLHSPRDSKTSRPQPSPRAQASPQVISSLQAGQGYSPKSPENMTSRNTSAWRPMPRMSHAVAACPYVSEGNSGHSSVTIVAPLPTGILEEPIGSSENIVTIIEPKDPQQQQQLDIRDGKNYNESKADEREDVDNDGEEEVEEEEEEEGVEDDEAEVEDEEEEEDEDEEDEEEEDEEEEDRHNDERKVIRADDETEGEGDKNDSIDSEDQCIEVLTVVPGASGTTPDDRDEELDIDGGGGSLDWVSEEGGGPGLGPAGTVFHLRLVGSVDVAEESGKAPARKTTTCKRPKKDMVMEAVSRLKALAPDGESQPSTEVDLFISTEKIMVLNTDLKEIMMDHALRTISYIADIGDLVVLMARRRVLPTDDTGNNIQKTPKMICHVFESDEAQFIAQSIGQAFQVAYLEFLKANGIEDHSFVKEMDYQEVLNSQEIFGDELQMFAKKELQKEVVVPKMKSEILGVVVVESGWGSMVPTVVIANLSPTGAAAKCGQLNIGDQIIAINGVSLVGLPLSTCQNYIKNTKYNTAVKLTVVPCPPVVEVKIRRPDTKYQLGFSVQNGVICSLLRGGIAERGGVRVGHRIIDINSQSVVAVPHEKIVNLLATSVGEIRMKTMPTSIFRLLTGQETPQYI